MSKLGRAGLIVSIVGYGLTLLGWIISMFAILLVVNTTDEADSSTKTVANGIFITMFIVVLIYCIAGLVVSSLALKKQSNALLITSGVLGVLSVLGAIGLFFGYFGSLASVVTLVGGILTLCGKERK